MEKEKGKGGEDVDDLPGNPPIDFRSQRRVSRVEKSCGEAWRMVTVKMPPVVGIRATSPREVENVERSSWANCIVSRQYVNWTIIVFFVFFCLLHYL